MSDVSPATLLPSHVKAARAFLDWTAKDLAKYSSIGISTVKVFESGKPVRDASKQAMIDALTDAGIEFQNGGNPGVRLVKG